MNKPVTPRVEMMITGILTLASILVVGALKVQGWIDADTATLATGTVVGGGLGWGGKTAATSSATP